MLARSSQFLSIILCLLALSATPALAQPPTEWPNLDVLTEFPNPNGTTCALNGNAPAGSEKGRSNALKNRYTLPAGGIFDAVGLNDIMAFSLGPGGAAPLSNAPTNARAVTVVGYVREVKRGGTRGESCNCGARGNDDVDTHIDVVLDPNNNDASGKGMVVVEVAERSRRLAAQGLLPTNIGNDWSYRNLRDRLLGRWVKFSGWMFYDPDHHLETWQADPQNNLGRPNWRQTSWEVHPVMAIEAGVPRPGLPPPAGGTTTRAQILERIRLLEEQLRQLKADIERLPPEPQ
jgi:hypothetical protein